MQDQNIYRTVVLVRMGEIALKGLNRGQFVKRLEDNLRQRLVNQPNAKVTRHQARLWIEPQDLSQPFDVDAAVAAASDVFGIVSTSPVRALPLDIANLEANVLDLARAEFTGLAEKSFKVEVKRINKDFPLRSYDLACHLGDFILDHFPDQVRVDVHEPDVTFSVELRDEAYLYTQTIPARRGLPVGTGGQGLVLLSGGIDSPVAAYMMASRGMKLSFVYFHTHPYTSPQALDKVKRLAHILTRYTGRSRLYVVDFTKTQLTLNETCPEEMLTIVMRRMMMRIAETLSLQNGMKGLVTGESLGQVASQTLEAIALTNRAVSLPVLRPLIGLDKEAIIKISREIGTYETSILPYDDCCTVFVAKHPKTHPTAKDVLRAERDLIIPDLVQEAATKVEKITLN